MNPELHDTQPVVDFDQHGEFYAEHWREQLADLRERCPVAWTKSHDGFWVITKHDDIMHIERHPEVFSCDNDLERTRGGCKGIRIPSSLIRFSLNESDPPEHTALRKLEAPFFSIQALKSWINLARDVVNDQIDSIIESGKADLVHDITIPVPAQVTLRLVGVPMEQWRDFMATSLTSYLPPNHPNFPNAERARIAERLEVLMAERKQNPREDVISALVHAKIAGAPLPHATAKGMLQSLLFGGFDTTAATSANALNWLQNHPEYHARLITDDKYLERAVDEFLRVFPPVMGGLARTVTQDTELRGQLLKKGDRVLLMFNSGNFDADRFECPEEIRLERVNARQNLAFGAGPHRCLGSVLGMAEVGVIIRAVLERLPDYKIDHETAKRVPRMGGVNSWLTMPITFTPGTRRGDTT
jgi:cytochrome P450